MRKKPTKRLLRIIQKQRKTNRNLWEKKTTKICRVNPVVTLRLRMQMWCSRMGSIRTTRSQLQRRRSFITATQGLDLRPGTQMVAVVLKLTSWMSVTIHQIAPPTIRQMTPVTPPRSKMQLRINHS
ncbi:hypothetical protein NP493_433g02023 [Ridgeia piscesae]|uniref:Uncharacterized protein n=1 Tax=Ridgeia piscesae TaxID=27915 RepID=A0AAD9L1E7_RIDPI|nr:hypothetical protein NP493_433g02023 [Ridgeia piscesae]